MKSEVTVITPKILFNTACDGTLRNAQIAAYIRHIDRDGNLRDRFEHNYLLAVKMATTILPNKSRSRGNVWDLLSKTNCDQNWIYYLKDLSLSVQRVKIGAKIVTQDEVDQATSNIHRFGLYLCNIEKLQKKIAS